MLVVPAAAWAVRPHASPVAQADYRGSDPEGRVAFHMTLAYNDGFAGHPASWEYAIYAFRFATECNRAGVRLPANVTFDKKQRRAARILRFSYSGHGVRLRLTISGKGLTTASGTVRISSRRCDGDWLPFTASIAG